MAAEKHKYIETTFKRKDVDLQIQVRAEKPEQQWTPYVLDLKKGDTGAITLNAEEAKFLRDWLNFCLEKHWNG